MRQFIGLLFFALALWVFPVAIGTGNKTFARVEALLSPKFSSSRQKALGDLVMSPSKDIEKVDQWKQRKDCKGVGMDCHIAEDCCTFLCLRRYNECVF